MEITFLGTSSMVPTENRNQSAILISYKGEGILVDCGEGTQRQLKIAKIPITKVTKILISHWHGDHTFGLPGLISTMGASNYHGVLEIYGPKGTKKKIEHMFDAFIFDRRVQLKITEISQGKFYEDDDFLLEALPLNHGIETFGYILIEKDRRRIELKKVKEFGIPEGPLLGKLQDGKSIDFKGKKISPDEATYIVKGKKIGIISDSSPCNNCDKIAQNADLLICESTYESTLEDKGEEYAHMTAKQAAEIANRANAKKLILTHFSARYKDIKHVEDDAKQIFDNSRAAWDLMRVEL